eukprot:2190102-Rhodomonas_salina.1
MHGVKTMLVKCMAQGAVSLYIVGEQHGCSLTGKSFPLTPSRGPPQSWARAQITAPTLPPFGV